MIINKSYKLTILVFISLFLFYLISVNEVSALEYDEEFNVWTDSVVIDEEGTYRIYQSSYSYANYNTIEINADCIIYLGGVNIYAMETNAMKIALGVSVELILEDGTTNIFGQQNPNNIEFLDEDSTISSNYTGLSAINVPAVIEEINGEIVMTYSQLTISSSSDNPGSLYASGTLGYSQSTDTSLGGGGAGIGGNGAYALGENIGAQSCGNITINGGIIIAMGGISQTFNGGGGSGIGAGGSSYFNDEESIGTFVGITINGGQVTAMGASNVFNGYGGSGIGYGGASTYPTITTPEINLYGGSLEASTWDEYTSEYTCAINGFDINVYSDSFELLYYNQNDELDSISPNSTIFLMYIQYVVNFDTTNTYDTIPAIEVTYIPEDLPIPTRYGYEFLGWYYDFELENPVTYKDILTEDTTLYAKWNKSNYLIYLDGSTIYTGNITPINSGYLTNDLPIIKQDGYIFLGWFWDEQCEEVYNGDSYELIEDIILYAKWEVAEYDYYIDYEVIYGATIDRLNTDSIPSEDEIPKLEYDNYIFIGWYHDVDFTIEANYGMLLTKNITLYAKWELETFTITLDCTNYYICEIITIKDSIIPYNLPELTSDEMTFEGWYLDGNLSNPISPGIELDQNITLYAKWGSYHEHQFTDWQIYDVGETYIILYQTCLTCEYTRYEKLESSSDILDYLEDLTTNEDLAEVKNMITISISDEVKNCYGVNITYIVDQLSGRLDEFELSSDVNTQLMLAYADALSSIQLERAKQSLLLSMASDINTINNLDTYTQDSITTLNEMFYVIENQIYDTTNLNAVENLTLYWDVCINNLITTILTADNGLLKLKNGFTASYTLSINKVNTNDALSSLDNILGTYSIFINYEDNIIYNMNNEIFTVYISNDDDLSKVYKVKVAYLDDEDNICYLDAEILNNQIVFETYYLTEFTIIYTEAAPIYPFYIISGVIVILIGLNLYLNYRNNKNGGGVDESRI